MSVPGPEVEAKLALPGTVYWRLRDDPELLELPLVGRGFERQTNLFYDTPDGRLRRAGATLRARRIAGRDDVEWTLKSGRQARGSVQSADEQSALAPDADDALAAIGDAPPVAAARRLAGGPLGVVAASLNERTVLRTAAPGGGEIEVALDRLRIPGDPVFVDYELEAESHGARRADVEALAARLARRLDLRASRDTKRARLQAYADGRLGPPRIPAGDLGPRTVDLARASGSGRRVRVAVVGLAGSPAGSLAAAVASHLQAAGIGADVSTDADWLRADLRLFVASSVHWRLLRYLAAGGVDADAALGEFARLTAADRRTLEGLWREADLVGLADTHLEPAIAERDRPLAADIVLRPDDLADRLNAEASLAPTAEGCVLSITATAWPADLAHTRHEFALSLPTEQAASMLSEVGYQ